MILFLVIVLSVVAIVTPLSIAYKVRHIVYAEITVQDLHTIEGPDNEY